MELQFQAILDALNNFTNPEMWLIIAIGVVIGLVFGVIPGISGMLAITLMLPFIWVLTPMQALPLMMTILAIQFMGGAISAILLNLPGTPGSSATLIDGFPMTQRGEGGRALGAAQTASGLGNILTALVALAVIPLILQVIYAIHNADMVFIILLGITFIGVLASGSMVKGLLSGILGLMISFIGFQQATGADRFNFGILYLYDGIPLIPLMLGLFAIPEMVALATRGGTIAKTQTVIKGAADVMRGVKDVFTHWPLVLRSQLIGFFLGAIPGVGASPATFIAYGQAKQTSKHPETFGKGNVEGVIAVESANNAVESGALLTTLALGIPGSPVMALLLGAMTMQGLFPGPQMLTKNLDLSLTLIWIIAISGVIGVLICLPIAPYLSKIAYIPGAILVPIVLVLALTGAFGYNKLYEDVVMAVIFGIVGLMMRRFDFNRPALLLGYILGSLFEKYFFIAFKVDGPLFFVRPISLGIIFTIIAVIVYGAIRDAKIRRRTQPAAATGTAMESEITIPKRLGGSAYFYIVSLVFVLFLVLWSIFGMQWGYQSKLLPIVIGSICALIAAMGLYNEIRNARRGQRPGPEEEKSQLAMAKEPWHGYLRNMLWVVGFLTGIFFLGYLISIPLFVLFYMKRLGAGWLTAIISAVLATGFLYTMFEVFLDLELYRGLFLTWFGF
ncbi:tripartite tricarboxylate transporter permease [Chloroflexota bacterium]